MVDSDNKMSAQIVYQDSRIASLNARVDELHDLVEEKAARIVALESRCYIPPYSRDDPATVTLRSLARGELTVAEAAEFLTDWLLRGEQHEQREQREHHEQQAAPASAPLASYPISRFVSNPDGHSDGRWEFVETISGTIEQAYARAKQLQTTDPDHIYCIWDDR